MENKKNTNNVVISKAQRFTFDKVKCNITVNNYKDKCYKIPKPL